MPAPTTNQPKLGSNILALTMGDPAGIGLDITLKAWQQRTNNNIPPFVLYANASALGERAKQLGIKAEITRIASPTLASTLFKSALPVIDIPLRAPVTPKQPSADNATSIIRAIDQAVTDVNDGFAGALVTNPISKAVLYGSGFKFPGHTEYLAHLAQRYAPAQDCRPVMMLASMDLRVVPLTIHIPLRNVPAAISQTLIVSTLGITARALKTDFGIQNPRIAVAGLNPHAGEDGAMGSEETEIVAPAIARLILDGLNVSGPHSADTLFHDEARKNYDAVLAMYHDQALIPLKTLAFDKGVNVTLGLPFVRTSPDHGTAFDIAGTGRASAASLVESLKLASSIAARRKLMATGTNPPTTRAIADPTTGELHKT